MNALPAHDRSSSSLDTALTPLLVTLEADAAQATREVSPTLYGLFYEDSSCRTRSPHIAERGVRCGGAPLDL